MEQKIDNLITRFGELETRLSAIEDVSCRRENLQTRQPSAGSDNGHNGSLSGSSPRRKH